MAITYYITGPDGSGKTTFLKAIEQYFSTKDVKTINIWLRSPKILSKPLMAYCRLVKLTKYITIDGIKYGDHEFYRSKSVSWFFPWLQLVDFKIKLFFIIKKMTRADIVLLDRFALDTLADLMVDTERYDLYKTYIGKSFIKMIPPKTKIVVLSTAEINIRKRKKDTLHDTQLEKKIKVYDILSKNLNLKVVDNNRDYGSVKTDILNYFLYECN
ncbi:MAG: hypothetical protein K8R31_04040 [Bacteroidales bacterium]|nr:hypothetical protein [Bacteroidales bacterium]